MSLQRRNFWWAMSVCVLLMIAWYAFVETPTVYAATDCTNADVPQAECEALLDLYNSTDGANWIDNTNWGQTNIVCEWYGVSCSAGHVRYINLSFNGLKGTIPSSIDTLTSLDFLMLSQNQLSGAIPDAIGNLPNLKELHLNHNQLTGTIPTSIGNLSGLYFLVLSNNNLSGSIPDFFAGFTDIVYLYLSNNQFSGSIPASIGNLTTLIRFNVNNNRLDLIPESMINLSSLSRLEVHYNQFDENDMSTSLLDFVDAHYYPKGDSEPNWRETQTLPPIGVVAGTDSAHRVALAWNKRGEDTYAGRFEVGVSTTDGGPYTFDAVNYTADKDTTTHTVRGLQSETAYYFVVRKTRFAVPDIASESTSANSAQVSAITPADPTTPPSKPKLVSPDNNAVIVGEMPVLVWNANPAAQQVNRYRVFVVNRVNQIVKIAIVNPLTCTLTCELDTATLGVAFKNGTYRWWVEARNVKGTKLSNIRAFTLQLPGRPVLLAPIDTTTSPTPTFTWELRGTPLEYRLEIFNAKNERVYQSAFEPLANFGCDAVGETCTFVLPINLHNGVHTWRVIARNNTAFPGLTSMSAFKAFTVSHPAVPTITAPKDNVVVNVAKPLMQWTDTLNSANVEYRVVILKGAGNTFAYQSTWLDKAAAQCDSDTECAFEVTAALDNGAYRWFLQVRETIGSVTYVKRTPGYAEFKVLFPDRPVPQSPIGTVVSSPTPTFTWGESANVTEYRVLVRNIVSRKVVYNSGWQTVICSGGVCSFVGTKALPNRVYQWRVEARNTAEAPNIAGSGWKNFTIKSPGVASNLAGDITGTLTWDAAAGATEYRVLIQRTPSNTAAYTSAWFTCADPTCSHAPNQTFDSGKYRWRVQARNANGFSNSVWAMQTLP